METDNVLERIAELNKSGYIVMFQTHKEKNIAYKVAVFRKSPDAGKMFAKGFEVTWDYLERSMNTSEKWLYDVLRNIEQMFDNVIAQREITH